MKLEARGGGPLDGTIVELQDAAGIIYRDADGRLHTYMLIHVKSIGIDKPDELCYAGVRASA